MGTLLVGIAAFTAIKRSLATVGVDKSQQRGLLAVVALVLGGIYLARFFLGVLFPRWGALLIPGFAVPILIFFHIRSLLGMKEKGI